MTVAIQETLYPGYAQTMIVDGPMLADEKTEHQHIQIFDTPQNGRVMTLDGIVQISDRDEASYSEMLVHPPLFELADAKSVLIVGGGDGAVAEEAVKHEGVLVEMCEIDGRVVELCKERFAHVNNGVFDHPRFTLRVQDACEHLKDPAKKGKYDVVIADRPDPVGPAKTLFQTEFYALVRDALSARGIAVFQNGAPFYQPEELTGAMERLRGVYAHAGAYITATPSYIGGFMALTWASSATRLGAMDPGEIERRFTASGIRTDYYNPRIHVGAFALPQWIRRLVE